MSLLDRIYVSESVSYPVRLSRRGPRTELSAINETRRSTNAPLVTQATLRRLYKCYGIRLVREIGPRVDSPITSDQGSSAPSSETSPCGTTD
jgi:hypothetical protein